MKSKNHLLLILFISFFIYSGQNLFSQRKTLFNDNWKFRLDTQNAESYAFDDADWRTLDLPHDWSIEGQIHPTHPMGNDGGYFPSGIGWYRKSFSAPNAWKGKKISIHFEGVYMNSEVFINGKSLGVYPYGYSAFTYELTPFLNFGEKNVIAVKVDNSQQKNARWYTGSGIYRHVWILVTEQVHFEQWGVSVTTPEVNEKQAKVFVSTKIKNETDATKKYTLISEILDTNQKTKSRKQVQFVINGNSNKEISQYVNISKPELWSPETPYLYTCKVQIKEGKNVIDEEIVNFGIRTINFTVENGFQLNGKTLKLNGGCAHSDNGSLGAASFDRAEERKVLLLKNAGFNAVRTAHNLPSESFLDACDKYGLLVIDESFDVWRTEKTKYDYSRFFDKWWEKDIEAMVLRDRNHPSIIMWSVGNEVIERKSPEAVKTARMLIEKVKSIDPTRPVTSAMTTWDSDWEIFDPLMAEHDVCGYNYELYRAPDDHKRVPDRIILQTESYPRDAFQNWKLVNYNSYILGDFVWTALDYLGESGIGRWYYSGDVTGEHYERDLFPWHAAYCGDIDLLGQRKPISYYRDLLYNDDKKLYMAVREPNPEPRQIIETRWSVWPTWESWNWPGFEGKNIQVEVYSKYQKVKLYLNNNLIGEKETTEAQEFKAIFDVPYKKGVLKAVGVDNGKELESKTLQTSDEPTQISLQADRKIITAGGQDLAYITVEIADKNGHRVPNADNRLNFEITGPGLIAGIDNADIKDIYPYVGNSRKAWKGRALVIIRSTKQPGDITLKVISDGLNESNIVIKSE
ncbi:MAG: glycoside hydrolase family 2 protein [Porphyromonadaceae bacterium]|nr:glycoside hydrolase family 2 protein [Porphyromonadaceae bacterium]